MKTTRSSVIINTPKNYISRTITEKIRGHEKNKITTMKHRIHRSVRDNHKGKRKEN